MKMYFVIDNIIKIINIKIYIFNILIYLYI